MKYVYTLGASAALILGFAWALPAAAKDGVDVSVTSTTTVKADDSMHSEDESMDDNSTSTQHKEDESKDDSMDDNSTSTQHMEDETADDSHGQNEVETHMGGTEDVNVGVGEMHDDQSNEDSGNNSDSEHKGSEDNGVSVHATEVHGWDTEQKDQFLAEVKSFAQVQSGQDLDNFATGVLLKDENVEEVSADDQGVEVHYHLPAKFLGLFGGSLTANVEADAEGKVKVRYPWFSFLFQKLVDEGDLEATIESQLPSTASQVATSASVQAQVMQTLTNILKQQRDAAEADK